MHVKPALLVSMYFCNLRNKFNSKLPKSHPKLDNGLVGTICIAKKYHPSPPPPPPPSRNRDKQTSLMPMPRPIIYVVRISSFTHNIGHKQGLTKIILTMYFKLTNSYIFRRNLVCFCLNDCLAEDGHVWCSLRNK